MSTTYMTQRERPKWCKAISSVILDALMPSTNTNDEDKSSPKKQDYLTKSLKRPAKCDEEQLVSPSIRFIPPQLQKAKKTLAVTSSTGSPIEEEIHSSSSDSSGSRKQISKIAPSLNSRYSSPSSEKLSSSSLETSSGSESQETTELSICSTPENISTIVNRRTPDSRNKPWKRSINYEYRLENPGSANSSPNSSYCTPESSPSDWGSAVKRQRTSWNDSYNNLNDSFNSEYLSESSRSCDSSGAIQPELIGYQMVGDSQFCRFGQQILGLRRVSMPNCPGRIGICVSGQTISDLHRRVKEKFYPISDKIILMIGTNDFLRNVDVTTMCHELSELVKTLQESASNIVLLTLPPIPKLEKKHSIQHFMMLDKYNSYIRSLEDGDKIRIADVSPLYMSTPPYQRCRMQLFEIYFGGPARRHDLIHLNRQGLEVIRNYALFLLRVRIFECLQLEYEHILQEIQIGESKFQRLMKGGPLLLVKYINSSFYDHCSSTQFNALSFMGWELIAHDVLHKSANAVRGLGKGTYTNINKVPAIGDVCVNTLLVSILSDANFCSEFRVNILNLSQDVLATSATCSIYSIKQLNSVTLLIDTSMVNYSNHITVKELCTFVIGDMRVLLVKFGCHFLSNTSKIIIHGNNNPAFFLSDTDYTIAEDLCLESILLRCVTSCNSSENPSTSLSFHPLVPNTVVPVHFADLQLLDLRGLINELQSGHHGPSNTEIL